MTNTKFPTMHFRWMRRSEVIPLPNYESTTCMMEVRHLQQFWQCPDGPDIVDGICGEWVDVPEVAED